MKLQPERVESGQWVLRRHLDDHLASCVRGELGGKGHRLRRVVHHVMARHQVSRRRLRGDGGPAAGHQACLGAQCGGAPGEQLKHARITVDDGQRARPRQQGQAGGACPRADVEDASGRIEHCPFPFVGGTGRGVGEPVGAAGEDLAGKHPRRLIDRRGDVLRDRPCGEVCSPAVGQLGQVSHERSLIGQSYRRVHPAALVTSCSARSSPCPGGGGRARPHRRRG